MTIARGDIPSVMELTRSSAEPSVETPVIELHGVSKRYVVQDSSRDGLALQEATLSVGHGEFVSLLGPSGCGKTTLLKIAAGLLAHSSGEVRFEGRAGAPPPNRMGFVFQGPVLLPWRTVLDNVMLPAQIQRLSKREAKVRAVHLLELLGLGGTERNYPWELSGGMQQRVSIARSLLNAPDMLFMDEPFGALDAMTRETLNFELQRVHLQERLTTIFVTHSITEAVLLSDRIALMSAGPGRVVGVLDVNLPRPRRPQTLVEPGFVAAEAEVREMLAAAHGTAGMTGARLTGKEDRDGN